VGIHEEVVFVQREYAKRIQKKIDDTNKGKGSKATSGNSWGVSERGKYVQWDYDKFRRMVRKSPDMSGMERLSSYTNGYGETYQIKFYANESATLEWTHTGKLSYHGSDSKGYWTRSRAMDWMSMIYEEECAKMQKGGEEEDEEEEDFVIQRNTNYSKKEKGKERQRSPESSPEKERRPRGRDGTQSPDRSQERERLPREGEEQKREVRTPLKLTIEVEGQDQEKMGMLCKRAAKQGLNEVTEMAENCMINAQGAVWSCSGCVKCDQDGRISREDMFVRLLYVVVAVEVAVV
jgi:hypothetical protein